RVAVKILIRVNCKCHVVISGYGCAALYKLVPGQAEDKARETPNLDNRNGENPTPLDSTHDIQGFLSRETRCICNGKKRSSGGRPVDSVTKALKEVCPKGMKPEMDVTNLMQDAFNQADENKDNALNVGEVAEFAELIVVNKEMSTSEVTIRIRFLYITQAKTRLDPAALLLQLDAILPETQVLLHTPVTPNTQDSAKPDNDVLIGALSQACPDLDFAPDTQVSQLVQDAFQDVDANKDGQLNANEVAEFATMIGE
ncbi:hypothetical protein BaRGS_00031486, partial [Batillaria attramentaria]